MKKKVWIPILCLILVLFVPIPTGNYKDGGTREYTALTYKIVKWNHITADAGGYNKLKIYPFPMNFLSIDSLLAREEKNFKEQSSSLENTSSEEYILLNEEESQEEYGYCGNTQTTVIFEDKKLGTEKRYTFTGEKSVKLTDILRKLSYDDGLCKCRPEFTVITEFGTYGVKIDSEGYARTQGKQSDLSGEQYKDVSEILNWAVEKAN